MADENLGLLARIGRALQVTSRSTSQQEMKEALDRSVESGVLPSRDSAVQRLKASDSGRDHHESRIDYRQQLDEGLLISNAYGFLRQLAQDVDEAPPWGDPERDHYLSKYWRKESILAGAVYSMSAKMTALSWTVTGQTDVARKYAKILSNAAYSYSGYDWGGFISSTAEDFYTADRGVFWEVARDGNPRYGPMVDIGHIDSLACWLTGNVDKPVYYSSPVTGQDLFFKPGEYIHFNSMPSPREDYYGMGFCALSRALRAAKLLVGLNDYDEEKLSNLPPEGVAAVTGLTMSEFQNALTLWRAERQKNKSLTFPQVLWLVGSMPQNKVSLDFVGFSQMPESFDRKTVVQQYVYMLALVFGVDAREFWPVSTSTLGTAAESEIQHMKAKGKGPGEFISITERHLNSEVPPSVKFGFDTQDIEEDSISAEIAAKWINAFLPLTSFGMKQKSPGTPVGGGGLAPTEDGQGIGIPTPGGEIEPLITDEQFLRLLTDRGVLPDYIVGDDRAAIEDTEIDVEKSGGPVSKFRWDNGTLKEVRIPPIRIKRSIPKRDEREVPTAKLDKENGGNGKYTKEKLFELAKRRILKQEEEEEVERNIHGKPIPDREVSRGSNVTARSIREEINLWRTHPELSKFAPTEDEEDEIVDEAQD